ncbi:MAG: low molecular weight protein-tyrosine-phosphatase [Anaerolineae bacterium]|nr:MAG: low molecular weight protein-tyrosine-phosphatase [Anaerolineae bacterium]
MTRLLFVCLGNIIRSPLAENLFRFQAEQAGVDGKYSVDSAGTAAWHVGESPDPRMQKTAESHGVNNNGTARKVRESDFDEFDWILAMDDGNRRDLLYMAGSPEKQAKVRLLREFDPEQGDPDVPDPYYGGAEGFETTYRIVERSVRGLLEALEAGEF